MTVKRIKQTNVTQMKQFRPRERTAWVKKKWSCHTKEIVFANLLLYLRKKKIAKIALVVLINSEEKLELTQDRGPGHERRGSLERRGTAGSHDKRSSWSSTGDEAGLSLDNFRPVTLTVSSFFKQVRNFFDF